MGKQKHPFKMWVNVADFLAKTQHLSPAELGSYVRLHFTMWLATDCSLPNSSRILSRIANVRACNWSRIWEAIKDLFTIGEKTVTNEVLKQDLIEAQAKILLTTVAGRLGGQTTQFNRGSGDPRVRGPRPTHNSLINNDGVQADAQANTIQIDKTKEERSGEPRPDTGSPSLEEKRASSVVPFETPSTIPQSPAPPEGPFSNSELKRAVQDLGESVKLRGGAAR